VNRADVYRGAEELGIPLDAHLGFLVETLTASAPALGLGGAPR
jgi:predicted hydrolase (HD superfamily)